MPSAPQMDPSIEIRSIDPPLDRHRETVVPYYPHAAEVFKEVFGRAPSRTTLTKYLYSKPGFPVKKGGPYVRMPVYLELKKPCTTVEAFDRFITLVRALELECGIADARY